MLKNSVKINNYLSNLWTNISSIKRIVYKAKKFSIPLLFILIWFKMDQIVHAWPNIAATYNRVFCLVLKITQRAALKAMSNIKIVKIINGKCNVDTFFLILKFFEELSYRKKLQVIGACLT